MALALSIWTGWIWPVLKISIPVPVFALLIALTWWHFDKTSSVRQAVDKAVDQYTNVTELAAANARIEELERQRLAGDAAQAWLQLQLAAQNVAEAVTDKLREQETADYENKLVAAGRRCTLDDYDLDWVQHD